MIAKARDCAAFALLLLLAALAAKLLFVADQAQTTLADLQASTARTNAQLGAVLGDIRAATRQFREDQAALTLATAIGTANYARAGDRAARLFERLDESQRLVAQRAIATLDAGTSLEVATEQAVVVIAKESMAALAAITREVEDVGVKAARAASAAEGSLIQSERIWPPLAESARNAERMTRHAAETAESIDVATRPLRKAGNRVLAVLKWVAGRFTFPAR